MAVNFDAKQVDLRHGREMCARKNLRPSAKLSKYIWSKILKLLILSFVDS